MRATALALTASSFMSLLGPRPFFVKTAFAAPSVEVTEIVTHAIDSHTSGLPVSALAGEETELAMVIDQSGNAVLSPAFVQR